MLFKNFSCNSRYDRRELGVVYAQKLLTRQMLIMSYIPSPKFDEYPLLIDIMLHPESPINKNLLKQFLG